jgi:YggT family protein
MLVALVLSQLVNFYLLLIFVWVLGSWFPQWRGQEWYRMVASVVEPYINLFRGLQLRIGMIDLTAMAAMFLLILFRHVLLAATYGGGFRL